MKKDVDLELLQEEATHRVADAPVAFPFSPVRTYSLSMENSYKYPRNLSSDAMPDLYMRTDVGDLNNFPINPAIDKNIMVDNVGPFQGSHEYGFPGLGVNMAMSSGCPTEIVGPNHGMNGPNRDGNFINPNSYRARNFHMVGFNEGPMNRTRQLADADRSFLNFRTTSEIIHQPDFVQGAHDNQGRVNACQPDHLNILDGKFLSLGYQSNSVYDSRSDANGRTSFPPIGHFAKNSLDRLSVPLPDFGDNVGGFLTDHSGNFNLSCNDHNALQAMTSGFNGCSPAVLPEGESNMPQFIPTPHCKSSELGNDIDSNSFSRFTSQGRAGNLPILPCASVGDLGLLKTMERTTQSFPFNSSILRSNHQNAFDPMRNSYICSNLDLPSFGGTSRQDLSGVEQSKLLELLGPIVAGPKPGQVYSANTAPNAGAAEGFEMFGGEVSNSMSQVHPLNTRHDLNITGQGAVATVKSLLSHPSATLDGKSRKRTLPSMLSTQEQSKKIWPRPSTYPSSPYLVKNALGHVEWPMPTITNSSSPCIIPADTMKGSDAISSTNRTALHPSAGNIGVPASMARTSMPFISPMQIPSAYRASKEISSGFPTFGMSSPADFMKVPSIPVLSEEGRRFLPPPITREVPPSFARTVTDGTYVARRPVRASSSRKAIPQNFQPSGHIPSPVTSSYKTSAVSSLRKRALAALAKSSAYRAAPFPASSSHIKWQGFNKPQPLGEKCLLCKRDLSYNPEGPIFIPAIAPAAAILPCGHTFHDDCLSRITAKDQSKDPPCIPCAIGDK